MKIIEKLMLGTLVCLAMHVSLAATPTPVQEELAKLLSTDLERDDRFGNAVAVDGNTAVIGAIYEEPTIPASNRGAAYVFTRDGSGAWSEQAKLVADDWAQDDQFGYSVALDGDTALIGAWYEDSDGYNGNGAVYVFTRDGNAWSQQAKLLAPDKASGDLFGWSVAVDGDTAVIGAVREDSDGFEDNGAAYIFTRSGGAWSFQAKLLADDKARWDSFGNAVAVSGDTVAIGAPDHSTPTVPYAGVVYVFTREGESWNQAVQLHALDMRYADSFGFSVDLEGNVAVIGAPDKASPFSSSGAAYVFTRDGSGNWSQQAQLLGSDLGTEAGMFARFGWSVAVDGDAAVVGSIGQDSDGVSNNGAAYVFRLDESGYWTEQARLLASDKAANDGFGWVTDISGATIIVGAPSKAYYAPGGDYTGAAYIYSLAASDGPPVVSDVTAGDAVFPGEVTLTAMVTDAESVVASAEYTLDGGANWTMMNAADDAFESASEGVTATLSGLSAGTYQVCVRASDVGGNTSEISGDVEMGDCDAFEVAAAELGIAFVGELLNADGDATQLQAQVTGPAACAIGSEIYFSRRLDEEGGREDLGYAISDESGMAALQVPLAVGVHEITVEVEAQYLGGDGDSEPECLGDTDTGIMVVADARASSTGGGWYKIEGLTPPRVNFGYTAQTKYNKKLDAYSTSGNLLWMHQDNYRLKGTINAGGKVPVEGCPEGFAACAAFAGEGTLYQYNEAYEPDCDPESEYGCEPEWINAIPNNPFIFFVNDGGIIEECLNKKKCKEVVQPDQFGIEIAIENVSGESAPVYLNGGNLVVR